MSDVNPPEPPIEPIVKTWDLRTADLDGRVPPWRLDLGFVAPYVSPTEDEIAQAIVDAVYASTGIVLEGRRSGPEMFNVDLSPADPMDTDAQPEPDSP